MNRKLSVAQLIKRHKPEIDHTEQVTQLAMQIFDSARLHLALKESDRELLKAAALLHDIGYRSNQLDHAKASARIVASEGLDGFTRQDRTTVAGAVILHSGSVMPSPGDLAAIPASSRRTAIRLAAILKIADGLDHGHIQDCLITALRRKRDALVITVVCRTYAGSIPHTNEKARLWNETYPLSMLIRPKRGHLPDGSRRFRKDQDESMISHLRRRLCYAFRTAADCRAVLIKHPDAAKLRRMRTALREARRLLRRVGNLHPASFPASLDATIVKLIARSGQPRFGEYLSGPVCVAAVRKMAFFARIKMNDLVQKGSV